MLCRTQLTVPLRAYIAASRRSDRSLEARVESARRASEIHKRRTGRSLRVTEQDVINEEMYEEEDDDLPLQYRRLTAHLNTNSPDFNRRLAAYLTNHVAMRNALDQAISTSYQQQNNGPAQMWPQQMQNMQNMQQPFMGNTMMNQTMMPPQAFQQNMMMQQPQAQQQSPTKSTFGQTPYPIPQPGTQTYRPNVHRSNTMANAQAPQAQSLLQRRAATAAAPVVPQAPVNAHSSSGLQSSHRSASSLSLPSLHTSPPPTVAKKSSSVPPFLESDADAMLQSAPTSAVAENGQGWSPVQHQSISPLTTALGPDAQMFFQGGFNNMPMFQQSPPNWGNEKPQQPFYSYNPNNIKARNVHPSFDGMNQTLAPGALDNMNDSMTWSSTSSATTDSPFTPSYNYGIESLNSADRLQKTMSNDPSPLMQSTSGYVTPGEAEWSSFIDPSSWADATV